MKILHVISSYNGGIYTFVKRKFPYLNKYDSEFHILAFENPSSAVLDEAKEYTVTFFKSQNPKKSGFNAFFKKVNVLMKKGQYDAIHCHLNGHRAIPYFLLSIWHKVPFIIHAHNAGETDDGKNKTRRKSFSIKLNQWINKKMTHYPVSCGEEASRYIFGSKESTDTIKWLPNSLKPDKYLKKDKEIICSLKGKLNIPSNKKIIGQVGRLDYNKNQTFTLEIAHEVSKIRKNYYWIIIGEGKDRPKLEELIEKYELGNSIALLGRKENVEEYYKVMDALLFPSYNEGFGMVAVEAQTSGTQVLASDTLSREIDLDLGLISYLSLKDKQQWINELNSLEEFDIKQNEVISKLIEKKLTDEQAAELYFSYMKKIRR